MKVLKVFLPAVLLVGAVAQAMPTRDQLYKPSNGSVFSGATNAAIYNTQVGTPRVSEPTDLAQEGKQVVEASRMWLNGVVAKAKVMATNAGQVAQEKFAATKEAVKQVYNDALIAAQERIQEFKDSRITAEDQVVSCQTPVNTDVVTDATSSTTITLDEAVAARSNTWAGWFENVQEKAKAFGAAVAQTTQNQFEAFKATSVYTKVAAGAAVVAGGYLTYKLVQNYKAKKAVEQN